jgi:outer membrane protein assembly factor BamB
VAQEEGLLPNWPPEGPPIVWRLDVGAGFSGVSVVGDRFFTLFAVEEGKATDGEYAGAFRVADGSELWRARIDDEIFSDDFGRGPRATPNLVEGTLYAQSARGRLVALRAASGEELFAIDLFEEYGFFGPQWSMMGEPPGKLQMPNWGYSATPLVEGDLVIVPTGTGKGRSLIAFDRRTGEERWTVLDQPLSYASPLGADLAGRRQVVWTADADLVGVSLSGEVLWTLPWAPTIGQPVFVPPSGVFVTTVPLAQFEGGALLLDVATVEGGAVRATPVWRNNRLKSLWASPLYYDGHIYGFDNATLRCLRAKDGEALWAQRGLGKGDLLAVDGRLIIYSDRGLLLLAEASPEGYKEKGRMKLFDAARTWTPPTLADGRLYVRADSELVQLDLRADVKEEP